MVVCVRRGIGRQHGVGDVGGLLSVLHLGAGRVRTLLVDGLLVVHHVFRARLHASGRHVTGLRLEVYVLCLAVVGCVVVELLLSHGRRCVRGVFHYAVDSVCCFLSATLVPSPLRQGPLTS